MSFYDEALTKRNNLRKQAVAGLQMSDGRFIPWSELEEKGIVHVKRHENLGAELSRFKGAGEKLILPSDITCLSPYSFEGAELKFIELNEGLVHIGRMALSDSKIESVHIPSSVSYIGAEFIYGSRVATITVADNNKYFDSRDNCNALIKTKNSELVSACPNDSRKVFKTPDSVKSFGMGAFAWSNFERIEGGLALEKIATEAITFCFNLKSLYFDAQLTSVAENAIMHLNALTDIDLPNGFNRNVFNEEYIVDYKKEFEHTVKKTDIFDKENIEIKHHRFRGLKDKETALLNKKIDDFEKKYFTNYFSKTLREKKICERDACQELFKNDVKAVLNLSTKHNVLSDDVADVVFEKGFSIDGLKKLDTEEFKKLIEEAKDENSIDRTIDDDELEL